MSADRAADFAIDSYKDRLQKIALDLIPIPLDIPMSRSRIMATIRVAQIAEIKDPQPGEEPRKRR